ncbi:MAG: nitroreductase family protein [Chloroflexota bacterium]|nr:nitroreductase family protein [Chloroflexota bacterium]
MNLTTLVKMSRSYRRFDESYRIDGEILRELVQLAQYSPTGNNMQPLKFWLSNTPEMNNLIFPHLGWAGSLKDWKGPKEGERPSAYIIILGDMEIQINFGVDHGIAAQSIMLGVAEKGLGGCMIGSAKREGLCKSLGIPERYKILLVLALGKPVETVITEPLKSDGQIRYYRDAEGVHHVPKRSLDDLIVHDA